MPLRPAIFCAAAAGLLAAFVVTFASLLPGLSRADYHYNRGVEQQRDEAWSRAVAEFSSSIAHDPGQPLAHYQRGISRLKLGRYEQAAGDFDAAIALDPLLAEAYSHRITTSMVLGRLNLAVADVEMLKAFTLPL